MRRLPGMRRLGVAVAATLVCAFAVSVAAMTTPASALGQDTQTAAEFTLTPGSILGSNFGGFGGQFNQHVFADISGPPPNLAGLETKVMALRPRYVRVFFNNTEWTFPDRMASFVRTVQLARLQAVQMAVHRRHGRL